MEKDSWQLAAGRNHPPSLKLRPGKKVRDQTSEFRRTVGTRQYKEVSVRGTASRLQLAAALRVIGQGTQIRGT